jgi:hypothetical protein
MTLSEILKTLIVRDRDETNEGTSAPTWSAGGGLSNNNQSIDRELLEDAISLAKKIFRCCPQKI